MLDQFGNNWIQKIPLTAKLNSANGLVQFWPSSEFFFHPIISKLDSIYSYYIYLLFINTSAAMLTGSDRIQIPSKTGHKDSGSQVNTFNCSLWFGQTKEKAV